MSPAAPFRLLLETRPLPPPGGPLKRRLAVRALVWREGRVLLVRSGAVGDWKFPGGGVEPSETPEEALTREVREETGYGTVGKGRLAGTALERAAGRDVPGSWFEMESRYYWVDVAGEPGPLALDDYERKLGFEARWVDPAQALEDNRAVAARGTTLPPWLERETRVLAWLVGQGSQQVEERRNR